RRLPDPDGWPVPAPVERARADDPLLPSRRIPRAEADCARPRVRARRVRPARAELLPCARNRGRLESGRRFLTPRPPPAPAELNLPPDLPEVITTITAATPRLSRMPG